MTHRAFRALWVASICSYVGSWIQDVGESWLMVSLTKSPLLVSMLVTSFTVPVVALALPSGALADRFDRRRILIFAQIGLAISALALAVVTWLGLATPAMLLAESALLGIGTALTSPPWQSLVPELVKRRMQTEAITLNSIAFNIARALGPALGGIMLGVAGPAWTFALNALSFGAVVWVLVRYEEVRRASELRRDTPVREGMLGSMLAPFRFVWRSDQLRPTFFAMATMSFAVAPVPAMLPIFAKRSLDASALGYGIMLGAMGTGAVLAGVLLRRARRRAGPRAVLSAAMVSYGVFLAGAATARTLPVAIFFVLLTGLGWLSCFSTLSALVQLASPPHIKSRVVALYNMVFFSVYSLGAMFGGVIADRFGVRAALGFASIGSIAAGALALRLALPSRAEHVTEPARLSA